MISEHLYIPRRGDQIFFINYYNDFMKLSDIELENAHISAKKTLSLCHRKSNKS
jgi:hypothetical protein